MVDIRGLMAKFLADDSRDPVVADKVRANWERVRQIAEKDLMNYRFYRPGNRYSRGLHPDYLPDAKVRKQPRRVPGSPKPKRFRYFCISLGPIVMRRRTTLFLLIKKRKKSKSII